MTKKRTNLPHIFRVREVNNDFDFCKINFNTVLKNDMTQDNPIRSHRSGMFQNSRLNWTQHTINQVVMKCVTINSERIHEHFDAIFYKH